LKRAVRDQTRVVSGFIPDVRDLLGDVNFKLGHVGRNFDPVNRFQEPAPRLLKAVASNIPDVSGLRSPASHNSMDVCPHLSGVCALQKPEMSFGRAPMTFRNE